MKGANLYIKNFNPKTWQEIRKWAIDEGISAKDLLDVILQHVLRQRDTFLKDKDNHAT